MDNLALRAVLPRLHMLARATTPPPCRESDPDSKQGDVRHVPATAAQACGVWRPNHAILVFGLILLWVAATLGADCDPGLHRGNPARTGVYTLAPVTTVESVSLPKGDAAFKVTPVCTPGTLYAPDEDGVLHAFDLGRTQERWQFQAEGLIQEACTVHDGRVFFGTTAGTLYCLDALTGQQIWHVPHDRMIIGSPLVHDGRIFYGSQDQAVYAVGAEDGKHLWRYETQGGVFASAALSQGRLYIGSNDQHLYALKAADGTLAWKAPTEGIIAAAPAAGQTGVYVGSLDGRLYAFDKKTGEQRWRFETKGPIAASPVLHEDLVIVGSTDTRVYAINRRTGKQAWRFATLDGVVTPPAVINGLLYVASSDWNVYVLDPRSGKLVQRHELQEPNPIAPVPASGYFFISRGPSQFLQGLPLHDSVTSVDAPPPSSLASPAGDTSSQTPASDDAPASPMDLRFVDGFLAIGPTGFGVPGLTQWSLMADSRPEEIRLTAPKGQGYIDISFDAFPGTDKAQEICQKAADDFRAAVREQSPDWRHLGEETNISPTRGTTTCIVRFRGKLGEEQGLMGMGFVRAQDYFFKFTFVALEPDTPALYAQAATAIRGLQRLPEQVAPETPVQDPFRPYVQHNFPQGDLSFKILRNWQEIPVDDETTLFQELVRDAKASLIVNLFKAEEYGNDDGQRLAMSYYQGVEKEPETVLIKEPAKFENAGLVFYWIKYDTQEGDTLEHRYIALMRRGEFLVFMQLGIETKYKEQIQDYPKELLLSLQPANK